MCVRSKFFSIRKQAFIGPFCEPRPLRDQARPKHGSGTSSGYGRRKEGRQLMGQPLSLCRNTVAMSPFGSVSRASPVHTAVRNCTRDEGGPFEVGNQVPISNHCKLLSSKAMVVSVAANVGTNPSG
jgi:hypothetical protein